ncbi:hypothetical protein [Streptomyces sp. NRRL S-646]|uniref:hypothetical protein n=1 Tax=Streptomyces sp. NRRL S-646 TaxID=1463917 RepID=UPI000AB2A9E4|nr:hypothetical protein [Streptomyces sp. NRRL S-646]
MRDPPPRDQDARRTRRACPGADPATAEVAFAAVPDLLRQKWDACGRSNVIAWNSASH